MSAILEITSEVAYDLFLEHEDTLLALLEHPLSREEVARRVGSARMVDRLLRSGLVAAEGCDLKAGANVYHQLRQEGMMTFLEHYVLPSLTPGIGFATLSPRYLTIDEGTQRGLRTGRVQRLFDELTTVSEAPADGPLSRFTVMVIGTSRILREEADDTCGDSAIDDEAQALEHLRQAAVQRATAAEKDVAVLSQYFFLADTRRFSAASAVVDRFVQSLETERASSVKEATYHLTVATHWRSATPVGLDSRGE